ncbi:hypothetical protein HK101_000637 [Irineochytrium annulatum]|nr:hypothetical protein HK101_000637 [Irineochytrium annulatum]
MAAPDNMDRDLKALASLLLAHYLPVNAITLAVFAYDKAMATSGLTRSRVSESSLLRYVLVGGVAGALVAVEILRHKSRKRDFLTAMWIRIEEPLYSDRGPHLRPVNIDSNPVVQDNKSTGTHRHMSQCVSQPSHAGAKHADL